MSVSYIAQIISLAITPFVFLGLAWVSLIYSREAIKKFPPTTPEGWLILGIVIAFGFSKPLDYGYWFVHWMCYFLHRDGTYVLTEYGPLANLIFRQIPLLLAAACHVKAATMHHQRESNRELPSALLLALAWTIAGLLVCLMI